MKKIKLLILPIIAMLLFSGCNVFKMDNMEDINVYVDLRMQNKWIREAFENKDMVSVSDILTKVEDLLEELDTVKEEYEDFKRDVEDNYKPLKYEEQLGGI